MIDRHYLLLNDLVRAGDASLSHPFSIFPKEVLAAAPEDPALMLMLLLLSRDETTSAEIPVAMRSIVSRGLVYFPSPTTHSSTYTKHTVPFHGRP